MNKTFSCRIIICIFAIILLTALFSCGGENEITTETSEISELTTETVVTTTIDTTVTTAEASTTEIQTEPTTTVVDEYTVEEYTTAEDDNITRLAFFSDVHIGKSNLPINPSDKFAHALDQVNKVMGTPDAIVFSGDITDRGLDTEYSEFKAVFDAHTNLDTMLCAVMGNHEYFRDGVVRFGGESVAFVKECQNAFSNHIGSLNTDTEINGIHIIGISVLNSAADYRASTEYLCRHIQAAADEDPTMPIIVVTHEGFGSMLANGGGHFGDELNKLIQKYPQIISVSGHTHYALNDPRMINQDKITTIQNSSLGADFWNYPGSDPIQPEGREASSQGLLMTVTPEKLVTITRYDFTNDCTIGEDWTIDIPSVVESKSNFKYNSSRSKNASAPKFDDGATIGIDNIKSCSATISFPAAFIEDNVSDGCVFSYKIEARITTTDAVLFSRSIPGDYHLGAAAKKEFSVELSELEHGTDYTLNIFAESSFGKVSSPLSATFSTPKDNTATVVNMPSKILDVDYSGGSCEEKISGLTCEAFGNPVLEGGMAILDKNSAYAYCLTDKEYSVLTNKLSIETIVYIDRDQTYPWGYVTVIGNAESGGFDISVTNGKGLSFEVNINGTYKSVFVPTPFGEFVHVIGSYDGQYLRIYINGELKVSEQCSGNIKHVGPKSRKLMVGADVNGEGMPQVSSNIKVTNVAMYSDGISIEQAKELYKNAVIPKN